MRDYNNAFSNGKDKEIIVSILINKNHQQSRPRPGLKARDHLLAT